MGDRFHCVMLQVAVLLENVGEKKQLKDEISKKGRGDHSPPPAPPPSALPLPPPPPPPPPAVRTILQTEVQGAWMMKYIG